MDVSRAAFFNIFADSLDEVGLPVGSWMDSYRLPESMREDPDLFLPNAQLIGFLRIAAQKSEIPDFAFHCVKDLSLTSFSQQSVETVLGAPTLFRALLDFFGIAHMEGTALKFWLRSAGKGTVRVVSAPKTGTVQNFSGWLQIKGVIEVVRAFAGAGWTPTEIAFMGDFPPGDATCEAFPNTRFLTRQKACWFTVPKHLLSLTRPAHHEKDKMSEDAAPLDPTAGFAASLRGILRAHLANGTPDIQTLAEINCLSVRTMQRGLSSDGMNFSRLLQEVRCEMAREMLADPDHRIIDISMAVGYPDPSNFARFFRETHGISPSEYRAGL